MASGEEGDVLSLSIGAASILAKVTRDRFMVQADSDYPGYGFARHKGYGVPHGSTGTAWAKCAAPHEL